MVARVRRRSPGPAESTDPFQHYRTLLLVQSLQVERWRPRPAESTIPYPDFTGIIIDPSP
jgi:hypothetical protein